MNVERCQAAADPSPSQLTLAASLPILAARVYTNHHHLYEWSTDGVMVSTLSKAGGCDGDCLAVSSAKLVRLRVVAGDSQKRTLIGGPAAVAAVSVSWRCRS